MRSSASSSTGQPIWPGFLSALISVLLVGCDPPEAADPTTVVRVPVGLTRHVHQSFDGVVLSSTDPEVASMERAAFDVRADADAVVELGVLWGLELQGKQWRQVRKNPPEPRNYTVRFWRQTWRGPRLLLEDTVELAVNEPMTFRFDGDVLDAAEEPARVLCEIEALGDEESASTDATDAADQSAGAGDPAKDGGTKGGNSKDVKPLYEQLACLSPTVIHRRKPREWNVLMLSYDTLRADHLSAYGYSRETSPHLDRFTAEAVVFTQAISPAPWTTPAHYSLFTGLNPSAHGNSRSAAEPFLNDPTLARRLREHGYHTVGITGGGSISSRFGMGNGFSVYREYTSYPNTTHPSRPWKHKDDTGRTFADAAEWLEANAENKFFLFLHHFEVHDPYEHTFFLDGTEDDLLTRRKALYDGDIRHADTFFGQLIDQLRELDLLSNTIIIFLSDHGDEFHEHYTEADVIQPRKHEPVPEISIVDHAHSLYDELLHVPLIFYVPDLEPARRVIDNQVRLIDVMPTLLDLLDITPAGPMQGESLLQLMISGERASDPPALAEAVYFGPERKAIRMDGYKYIWVPNLESQTPRTFRGIEQFELFNLVEDPGETTNLYHERPELAEKMHHALLGELKAALDIHERLREQRPASDQETEVEDDVLDALRALGYIE